MSEQLQPEQFFGTEITKIDEKWFARFRQLFEINEEDIELFKGDPVFREQQKQMFLNGEIENPGLDYPKIDDKKLTEEEQGLLALKTEILESETNEVLKQTYRWKINELIAKLRMLRATSIDDMRRFKKYSEFVYGKPNEQIFYYTINQAREKAKKNLTSDNADLSAVAKDLDQLLPDYSSENLGIKKPSDETFQAVKAVTEKEFEELKIKLPEQADGFSAEEIKMVFTQALEAIGATPGWKVELDDSSTAINVSQEQETVRIPQERKVVEQKLKQLIMHEIKRHVERRINGEKSRLSLLGLGLDRYISGEEGVAKTAEQIFEKEFGDFAGFDGHLAIGLATGVDGKQRDFRSVFEILKKLYTMNQLEKGKSLEEAIRLANNSAWNNTLRVFRGSDASTPGACYTKDIAYREGNIGVWRVVTENPGEMYKFTLGKYDPVNPRHLWILSQLGILESDLEDKLSEETYW